MSNLNLLAGVQNPFLWESDEMESVESWLGVLICRAAGADAARERSAPHGRAARAKAYPIARAAEPARRRVSRAVAGLH